MSFQLNEYQALAVRTAKPLETINEKLLHAALGAGSEVGEFAVATYKATHFMNADDHNIVEELGDICWYIALLCDAMQFKFDEIVTHLSDSEFNASMDNVFGSYQFKSLMGRHLVLSYFVGEIQTIVKGIVYYDKPINEAAIKHTAAMAVMTVFALAKYFGHEPKSVLEANINKLSKRYPDKFTTSAATIRADKQGEQQ